jgi:hypothetical protein
VERNDPEQPTVVDAERARVDLDPDLEEKQDDADVCEELELVAVDGVARRERRDQQADDHVADDGRQAESPHQEARARSGEEHQADLEDRGSACVHRLEPARTSAEVRSSGSCTSRILRRTSLARRRRLRDRPMDGRGR